MPITGGYVARDPSLGDLYGRYLFADLCTGQVSSVVLGVPNATGLRNEGAPGRTPLRHSARIHVGGSTWRRSAMARSTAWSATHRRIARLRVPARSIPARPTRSHGSWPGRSWPRRSRPCAVPRRDRSPVAPPPTVADSRGPNVRGRDRRQRRGRPDQRARRRRRDLRRWRRRRRARRSGARRPARRARQRRARRRGRRRPRAGAARGGTSSGPARALPRIQATTASTSSRTRFAENRWTFSPSSSSSASLRRSRSNGRRRGVRRVGIDLDHQAMRGPVEVGFPAADGLVGEESVDAGRAQGGQQDPLRGRAGSLRAGVEESPEPCGAAAAGNDRAGELVDGEEAESERFGDRRLEVGSVAQPARSRIVRTGAVTGMLWRSRIS